MSFFGSIGHAFGSVAHAVTHTVSGAASFTGGLVGHIPLVGKPFHAALDATVMGPLITADKIAGGARIDHAIVAGLKKNISGIKGVAPYAQAVVSMVPGIGQTVNAGIGAGTALIHGRRIDQALLDGVKTVLPANVRSIYDKAVHAASTAVNDNRAIMQAELNKLSGTAKHAYLVGSAMGHGLRLQTAVQKGASTPAAAMKMNTAGKAVVKTNPVLSAAIQVITDPDVKHGFEIGVGTLDHATPAAALTALRGGLNAKGQQGFDLALATHVGMVKKYPPAAMPPREQFGYFLIHGINGATPDQRKVTLANVAQDNSVRTGGDVAAKELNGNWFHHLMLKLHLAKAA